MTKVQTVQTHFVEFVPETLVDGILYVSMSFATVAHNCFCGCGTEVNIPLGRSQWTLTYDGDSISLCPSIGNAGFECRSHYWIRNNRVLWLPRFTQAEIDVRRTGKTSEPDGCWVSTVKTSLARLRRNWRRWYRN